MSARRTLDLDRRVAVIVAKMDSYPLHHGGLTIARSVGSCGVPVVAMVEDRHTPLARSRYTTIRLPVPAADCPPGKVLDLLRLAASQFDAPALVVTTDDEMAVFLNDHQQEVSEFLRVNTPPAGTAARLADKSQLSEVAAQAGLVTPRTAAPTTVADVQDLGDTMEFPVIVKHKAPFSRLADPEVAGDAIYGSPAELLAWAESCGDPLPQVIVQEYIPAEHAENWIYNGFRAPDDSLLSFSGQVLRSWPPRRGAATLAVSRTNPQVIELAEQMLVHVGFRGICDLDFVRDARRGRYVLLDFNPRYGANAGMFVQDSGLDLIRANHLALTGRPLPAGRQVDGVHIRVEHLDLRAKSMFPDIDTEAIHEFPAFWSATDPMPALVLWARYLGGASVRMARSAVGH